VALLRPQANTNDVTEGSTVEIDFDQADSPSEDADYTTVPEGTYLVRITEVRKGESRQGDERWGLRLVVAEGEFVGRQAAWDNLVFSHRGVARVRRVFEAFGLPFRGRVTVDSEDLVGRQAFAEIRPSEYVHPEGGRVRRNEVPYSGYSPCTDDGRRTGSRSQVEPGRDGDDIPF